MSPALLARSTSLQPLQRLPSAPTRRPVIANCSRAHLSKPAYEQQPQPAWNPAPLLSSVIGAGVATILLSTSTPAYAELVTVPADQVTSMAKPLKKSQTINKGQSWLAFILGASSLFGATIILENNEKWFPAIAKANKAMRAAQNRPPTPPPVDNEYLAEEAASAAIVSPEEQARLEAVRQERLEDAKLEQAVLDGLAAARPPTAAAAAPAEDFDHDDEDDIFGDDDDITFVDDEDEVDLTEESTTNSPAASTASTVQQAEYPAELGVADDDEEDVDINSSEASSSAVDGTESIGTTTITSSTTKKPLFEISSDVIEASIKAKEQEALSILSLEALERELEARKAAMSGGGGGGSGTGSTSE